LWCRRVGRAHVPTSGRRNRLQAPTQPLPIPPPFPLAIVGVRLAPRADEVDGGEAAEVLLINTLAPFVLNSKLTPLLQATAATSSRGCYIVNVSAMEVCVRASAVACACCSTQSRLRMVSLLRCMALALVGPLLCRDGSIDIKRSFTLTRTCTAPRCGLGWLSVCPSRALRSPPPPTPREPRVREHAVACLHVVP
jgi:hypothetical protein